MDKVRCFGSGRRGVSRATTTRNGGRRRGLSRTRRELFERLCLEGFQAGLSWLTVLRKREAFRAAFAGFEPAKVAEFGDDDVERLMSDPGIVRNRMKIQATIGNARALLALHAEGGRLRDLVEAHRPEPHRRPLTFADLAGSTPESVALSKDLKKLGFRFVGPTTVYALMQALNIVDDHLAGLLAGPDERKGAVVPGMTSTVRVRVPAKVNLALLVGGVDEQGYHELGTIFQAVSLGDEIVAERAAEFSLRNRGEGSAFLPVDDTNLAIRAAKLLAEHHDVDEGVRLAIRKRIARWRADMAERRGPRRRGRAGGLQRVVELGPEPRGAHRVCGRDWGIRRRGPPLAGRETMAPAVSTCHLPAHAVPAPG